jgi:hypothetical protein
MTNGLRDLLRSAGTTLAFLNVAAAAAGQELPRAHVGAGLGLDLLVGDASDFLDGGGSRFLMADFRMDARDFFHIRIDGALTTLEDDEDQFTGARAENDVLALLVGPQLSRPFGRWRPYAAVLAGTVAVHWRTESGSGFDDDEDDIEGAFALGAHAGLAFTLDEGDHPIALRLEARLIDGGTVPFARAPDPATPQSPTGLTHQDIAMLGVRVAVTLGF